MTAAPSGALRVLHVIPSVSPLRGGPSKAVLGMVAALREQGVEASILTTNDHGPGVDTSLPTGRWTERAGVPLIAFPRWSPPLQPLREFSISPALVGWLADHLADYDLLHVHAIFSFPSTWAMRQARRSGVPYLVRTIGQLSPWSLAQSPARKRWMLRLVERRNLEGAAALHYTTAAERQEAAGLALTPRSLVLPLGVDLPPPLTTNGPPTERDPDRPTRFLFLSRLHPKKQLERLLEALALLREQRPQAPWELRIAGQGDPAYQAELRALCASLGLQGRCQWLGHLEGEPKHRELAEADWFVLPSAAENFGIAVVEALAAGTPVIVSPEVAVAAMVEAAGAGLVCDSSPEQLWRCLESALAPPSFRRRQAARTLVENRLAWPAIARDLGAVYTAICAGDPPPQGFPGHCPSAMSPPPPSQRQPPSQPPLRTAPLAPPLPPA